MPRWWSWFQVPQRTDSLSTSSTSQMCKFIGSQIEVGQLPKCRIQEFRLFLLIIIRSPVKNQIEIKWLNLDILIYVESGNRIPKRIQIFFGIQIIDKRSGSHLPDPKRPKRSGSQIPWVGFGPTLVPNLYLFVCILPTHDVWDWQIYRIYHP